MVDVTELLESLQEAVRVRDRAHLDAAVSERMIWVMPIADNERGKRDWIDASLGVSWHWFEISVRRVVEPGDTIVVEWWARQSRDVVSTDDQPGPITAEGVVLDVWNLEDDRWRLVTRHPARTEG